MTSLFRIIYRKIIVHTNAIFVNFATSEKNMISEYNSRLRQRWAVCRRDGGEQVPMILFNISSAFDRVWWPCVLQWLHYEALNNHYFLVGRGALRGVLWRKLNHQNFWVGAYNFFLIF